MCTTRRQNPWQTQEGGGFSPLTESFPQTSLKAQKTKDRQETGKSKSSLVLQTWEKERAAHVGKVPSPTWILLAYLPYREKSLK